MSCDDCDLAHENVENNGDGFLSGVFYYRWGIANIAIVACRKHCKEVISALNKSQEEER